MYRIFALTVALLMLIGVSFLPTDNSACADSPYPPACYLPLIRKELPPTPTHTPTPTNTPVPTSTATPLPTPTPTLAPNVYIMRNHSYYVAYGYLHVVGELWNHTSRNIELDTVIADFFDSDGHILDTGTDYMVGILQAEGKTCFDVMLSNPPNWAYYQLYGTYYDTNRPAPRLTIFDYRGRVLTNRYEIVGQLRNDDSRRVEFAKVTGTLYNSAGIVFDCDYTYGNISDLNPGQATSFKLTYYARASSYTDVAGFWIQPMGRYFNSTARDLEVKATPRHFRIE